MVAGVTDDLDDSVVTPLGRFLQRLNVDIRLGSIVVTALVLFPGFLAFLLFVLEFLKVFLFQIILLMRL
jgi:hypothetical protein